jgi:hypothetical protein
MRIVTLLLLAGALTAQQPTTRIPNGSLAAQASGRIGFYQNGSVDAFGYFSFVHGLDVPVFSGPPAAGTAHFTFRSEKTGIEGLVNDRLIHFLYRPANGRFNLLHLYYHANPQSDFARPASFSAGEKIATFRTRGVRITLNPAKYFQMTSGLVLESSTDFTVAGRTINVRDFADGASLSVTGVSFPSLDAFLEQLNQGEFSVPFGGSLQSANGGR